MKQLSNAHDLCGNGWFNPKHPRFKELYANRSTKAINLKTKEVVVIGCNMQEAADKLGMNLRKLEAIKYRERQSCKGWVLLDTYNKIYSELTPPENQDI